MMSHYIKRIVLTFLLFTFCFSQWANAQLKCGSRAGLVHFNGFSLEDNGGPFLGLGVTYFPALRHMIDNPTKFESNLNFLKNEGFNYIRMLSMVGALEERWAGLEVSPVSFTNDQNHSISATANYWVKFREMVDLVYSKGMRTQITIFSGPARIMPKDPGNPDPDWRRTQHINDILANVVAGREEKIILLEVGNEMWERSIGGVVINDITTDELKEYGALLAANTNVLTSLTAPGGTIGSLVCDPGKVCLYELNRDVPGLDMAIVHTSRDGDWSSIFDCYDVYSRLNGLPLRVSNNEPIGPGSSVSYECDYYYLTIAPIASWNFRLPMYVFHSRVGLDGWDNANNGCGITLTDKFSFQELFQELNLTGRYSSAMELLPCNLPAMQKYGHGDSNHPFILVSGSAQNLWASVEGDDFFVFPFNLNNVLTLEARRHMISVEVYDPADAATPLAGFPATLNAGDQLTLPFTRDAYIVKGEYTDKYVKVLTPNGNETWEKGSAYGIQWESENIGDYVNIYLYDGATIVQTIASQTANDGSHLWTVPATLADGSNYKIEVESWEFTNYKDSSDSPFKIGNLPPAPALVWPVNLVNIPTIQPTLDWNGVSATPAVTNYQVAIYDETQTTLIHSAVMGTNTTYQVPFNLTCNTIYYWGVRAKNDIGWGPWSTFVYFETPEVPMSPVAIFPKNCEFTNTLNPVFRWNAANSILPVTNYELQVTNTGGTPIFTKQVGAVTSYTLDNNVVSFNGTYKWRVRAYNQCSWGPWNGLECFNTPQTPYTPTIIYPQGGAVTPRTVTLRWEQVSVTPAVDSYRLEIFNRDTGQVHTTITVGAVTSRTITLPKQTRYKWRIQAHNSKGWSLWCAYKNFITN